MTNKYSRAFSGKKRFEKRDWKEKKDKKTGAAKNENAESYFSPLLSIMVSSHSSSSLS